MARAQSVHRLRTGRNVEPQLAVAPRCHAARDRPRRIGAARCRVDSTMAEPSVSPLAGKPAPADLLVDLADLERQYYTRRPNLDDPSQRVAFGTSGHRGSSLRGAFNEAHILAI